jgi:hypothetical protein
LDCPSGATCCGGAAQTCDGTRLPTGDGTNASELVVSTDGLTVTDTITGLVWQRDGAGTRAGCADGTTCTWAEAKAYCAALVLGGASDWRLPAPMELLTILDFTKSTPSIDLTAFPSTPADPFWTSLPDAVSSGFAWYVYFDRGDLGSIFATLSYRVRCVR